MGLLPDTETTSIGALSLTETLSYAVVEPRAIGVDVSRYQVKMDWPKCAGAGAKFGYMRCTLLGTDNVLGEDWEWQRNSDLAPQSMQGVGAYHVIRPTKTGVQQAEFFLERYSKVKFNLPIWLDCEANESGVTPLAYSIVIEDFVDVVMGAGYDVMPYTRAAWWNTNVAANPLWPTMELCVARYTSLPEPWGNLGESPIYKPRDWNTWRFWQHSADGNGMGDTYGAESDSIDLDYYNGSEQDLADYIGVSPPQETGMEPLIERKVVTVLAGAVYPNNIAQLVVPVGEEWDIKQAAVHVSQQHSRLVLQMRKPVPDTLNYITLFDEYDARPGKWYPVACGLTLDAGYIVEAQVQGVDKDCSLNIAVAGDKFLVE